MLIVGIAGGTGSGKTTVVKKVMNQLETESVGVLHLDSYYRDKSHVPEAERQFLNFDHPESIEFELTMEHLRELKAGKTVQEPVYSYLTCTRAKETIPVEPREIMILEGILCLTHPELRELMDIKVYVDAPADERLIRVVRRDIVERGRDVAKVLERYEQTVRPMHDQFIEPCKRFADIIIPQGGDNLVAIKVLTSTLKMNLRKYNSIQDSIEL